ncbi:hypothetical protein O181_052415 [Austropuccinia psidii MF-1]|uniref:Integrase catalytic domain-containing protein n=1 Tax=Austropuccinia psidii MF-1 TaxID=1389203 RepID=A0A9Q3DYU2_9BASI|nr:hypothetical protein [Austropuccinia psidii MF-1]
MDWVAGLLPGGERSHNAFIVIVKTLIKTQIFSQFKKDDTAMKTAPPICNRVVSWTCIFTKIIGDTDLNFESALWKNIHQLFRTKICISIAYHPKSDGLTEGEIQNLEEMIRKRFEYSL